MSTIATDLRDVAEEGDYTLASNWLRGLHYQGRNSMTGRREWSVFANDYSSGRGLHRNLDELDDTLSVPSTFFWDEDESGAAF
jgi:hypothetical protein